MTKIIVHRSGLFTSVQDFGRPQEGDSGIPWGGVMDRHSYFLANELIGNNPLEAVLEITMSGPSLEFTESVQAVITGANMSPMVNAYPIENNKIITLKKGDVLSFGQLKNGCRSYVAFDHKINVPLQLSSKSTYLYAGLGGVNGRALKKGDEIELIERKFVHPRRNSLLKPIDIYSPLIAKAYTGPDFELLTEEQREAIFTTIYQVGKDSNRMGVRLSGEKVSGDIKGIISSGIVKGTVQLPPSGMPIVLMADAPTTGGYLRILNCTDDSINKLAQLLPGDKVVFDKKS